MYTHMYHYIYNSCIALPLCVYTLCVSLYMCVYIYIYICVHTYDICMYVCTYIHIYIYVIRLDLALRRQDLGVLGGLLLVLLQGRKIKQILILKVSNRVRH